MLKTLRFQKKFHILERKIYLKLYYVCVSWNFEQFWWKLILYINYWFGCWNLTLGRINFDAQNFGISKNCSHFGKKNLLKIVLCMCILEFWAVLMEVDFVYQFLVWLLKSNSWTNKFFMLKTFGFEKNCVHFGN